MCLQKTEETKGVDGCSAHRTKYAGNACVAIRDDGKVCAVGGWDGKFVFLTVDNSTNQNADIFSYPGSAYTRPNLSNPSEL